MNRQRAELRGTRGLIVRIKQRVRQGWRRVKSAFWPVLLAAVAACGAWAISHYLIGHAEPFFAPIAAWVCLGFSPDRQIRKVAELAIGVTLGVVTGEVVAHFLGTGIIPLITVIVTGSLIARFLDRGILLTIQAGVQGIVIVALPVISNVDGASGRWIDALVGSAIALLVAALTPGDARRRTRQLAKGATFDLAHMLDDLAAGLETANKRKILDALVEGRGTQGVLDEWSEVVRNAQLTVRISPASRYYLPELAELQHASLMVDRAMRNARVLTRRAATAIEHGTAPQDITAALRRTSGAVRLLGHALGDGQESLQARKELTVVAAMLTPKAHEGWHWQTLILIMRSLIVDLLQATGLSSQAASAHLG